MPHSPIPKRIRPLNKRSNNSTNATSINHRVSKTEGKFNHQTYSDIALYILILTT